MASLFSKFKSNTYTSASNATTSPGKRNGAPPPLSDLERIIAAASDEQRHEGSDKFFGMHNPSNTCYCNSVVQCLFYSQPFRKHITSFPFPTPQQQLASPHRSSAADVLNDPQPSTSRKTPEVNADDETTRKVSEYFGLTPSQRPPAPVPQPTSPLISRPEDNKESFEYMKKQAITNSNYLSMDKSNFSNYGMSESLFTALKDLFESMIANELKTGVVVPSKLLEILRAQFEDFRGPQHQDAHEFLNRLLNNIVEQVEAYTAKLQEASQQENAHAHDASLPVQLLSIHPPEKPSSWVHDLFEGTLTSETKCLACETVSQRDEAFLDLSVDLEEDSSVTSCLRKFSEEEMLCEKNKFHCDKCCCLQEAEKRIKVKRLPTIMAFHLKRFKYDEVSGRLAKLCNRVVYPYHIRISNTTDDAEDSDRLYELYAVIVHLGTTPFHGHYVSIIKTKAGGWLLFDDELVKPVPKDFVRNYFGDTRTSACAYVLFYQRTTDEAVFRDSNVPDAAESVHLAAPEAIPTDPQTRSQDQSSPPFSPVSPVDHMPGALDGDPILDASRSPDSTRLPPPLPPLINGTAPRKSSEAIDDLTDPTTNPATGKAGRGFSLKAGSLRLRPGSISLRQKQRVSSHRDERIAQQEPTTGLLSDDAVLTDAAKQTPSETPPEQSKSKFMRGFSIGRKKSSLLPST